MSEREKLGIPWTKDWYEDEYWIASEQAGYPIQERDHGVMDFIIKAANAYFPMLEALEELADLVEDVCDYDTQPVRATIKKARGE
jgi:hypothetical protein